MRKLAWFTTLLLLATACEPGDPAGWAKRAVSRTRTQEKLDALEQVRKAPGDRKAAVPHLLRVLQQAPRVRAEAALILGEIGDPSAAPGLIAAADPAAADRDGFDANRRIATALGTLRAREAVPLLQALTTSRDAFTQVAAVDALGSIGDPAGVDALAAVIASPAAEPVTVQHALMALGRIGDARAVPVVLHMLFEERNGASFFPQAAFAAVEIGQPMAAPLVKVLEGRDPELQAWAREKKIVQGALFAKAAQLLGDVGGGEGVPAVKPLGDLLAKERDPDARDRYCDALARIGDPAAIPALRAAAANADWDLREGALTALSRLGGPAELAVVEAARAQCGAACPRERLAAFAGMKARLEAAADCRDVRCWSGKLDDARPEVRDRAALEVGRAGAAAEAPVLLAAVLHPVANEADLAARYRAVLGLTWIAGREKLASGSDIAARIDGMIAAERGRRLTEGVNEDAFRLAARLGRK
jgi:HEAT repeat protein